jgi:hypothetical protein
LNINCFFLRAAITEDFAFVKRLKFIIVTRFDLKNPNLQCVKVGCSKPIDREEGSARGHGSNNHVATQEGISNRRRQSDEE